MTATTRVRVTITFGGRISGALGVGYEMTARRTLTLPSPFTEEQAKEAAHRALYEREGDSPAFENVRVISVAFN